MNKEYSLLFNTLTDSITELEQILERLQKAQLEAEKMLTDAIENEGTNKQIVFPTASHEKES